MVSKSQIKLITGLAQKKNRSKQGLFIVEGIKGINEILHSDFELDSLFTIDNIFNAPVDKTYIITGACLKKISSLKTPQTALAIFKIPAAKFPALTGLIVALDGIRDPGNLGTIIRLCDWFGIKNLVCSPDTVDCYNFKVVQATMGSITRVNIIYSPLDETIKASGNMPILGAFMDGEDVFKCKLPNEGVLVLGNEANGISNPISKLITKKISIPPFDSTTKTESLNVATAAAILLSEFRRQQNY